MLCAHRHRVACGVDRTNEACCTFTEVARPELIIQLTLGVVQLHAVIMKTVAAATVAVLGLQAAAAFMQPASLRSSTSVGRSSTTPRMVASKEEFHALKVRMPAVRSLLLQSILADVTCVALKSESDYCTRSCAHHKRYIHY